MNKKILYVFLVPCLFAMGGTLFNNPSSLVQVKADSLDFASDVVEITNGDDFENAINNAIDGLYIKLQNDISFSKKIIVPENCFVTVDLDNHKISYTSNEADNIGADLTSTLMLQNGTWSGTFDTEGSASGTIILNHITQVLPEGEDDLVNDGKDTNNKGVIFAGNTKMWIVNGCNIHRIATENGAINPGADSLNPWDSYHTDPSVEEANIAEKQPYNFENPAPAIVGSKSTWEVKATLNEDFTRAQEGGDTYSKVILLKDAELTENAILEAADKTFDLAGHTLTLGSFNFSITNNTGNNIIRNGKIVGSIDLSVGTGDVEISRLSISSDIVNNAHAITFNGGHYDGITTTTGQIYLNSGYFSGTYSGDKYTVLGGYYVNRPTDTQLFLGSEVSDCAVVEGSITYNYTVIETQPTKDNDYTVALNDTIEGSSFQWYKKAKTVQLIGLSGVKFLANGTLIEPGQVKTVFDSEADAYSIVIELNPEIFAADDIITFKSNVEASTYFSKVGEVTHLDGVEYSYTVNNYHEHLYFAIIVTEETTVYDISYSSVSFSPISSETNARLSHSVLDNTEYCCETYLDGVLVKTSNIIRPNAISFTCETDGATGDNPETVYQLDGRSITLPSNTYSKEGYVFDGWYKGSNKIEETTYTVGSSDETLIARLVICDHTYSDEWTFNGTHHWHAATCSHDSKTDYNEHSWNSGQITTQPTEEAKGVKTYTCTVCAATKTEDVAKLTHEKGQHHYTQSPSCTVDGNIEYYDCKNCDKKLDNDGKVLDSVSIAASGHDLQHHDAQAPTCTAIGWDAYDTCSKCSYTTYNEIAALGHNYSSQVTNPTCIEQGYTTHTCTRCSDSYKDTYTNATGHTAATDNAVLPTCTTTGLTEGSHCSVCNTVLVAQTEVAASGHDLQHHDAQAPTCTANGWDAYDTCSKCSYTTYNEIVALGHNYSSQVTKPTCTEQGYTTHTCTRCSDSYKDTYTNATGHTAATDNAVLPTCTTTGLTEGSHCSVCNTVLVAQTEVATSGHDWGEYVSNNDATLSADGTKTRTCNNDSTHKETVTDVGTQKIQVIDNTPSGETTPNVSIETEGGFNPNIVVEVKIEVVGGKVEQGSSLTIDYSTQIAKNETLNGVYDVKLLLNGDEIPVSYLGQNATITVKMLVPSELVGKTFRIIHVHDNSDIAEIKLGEEAGIGTYIIDENGYLVTKIDRLSEFAFIEVHEGLSVGAIIGIVFASLLGLLLLIYILGYFLLYRRGHLDGSVIRIIYKWLPRGDKNKNDSKDNEDESNKQ